MQYDHRITLQEIQDLEYAILKEFDQFAKENNIHYFLCGGTLLGAIRHHDFIPWDDDIDICLLRKDYDLLIEKIKENRYLGKEKRYKFLLPVDHNYIYPFIKMVDTKTIVYEKDIDRIYSLGVWLDVFSLDAWPESKEEIKRMQKLHARYKFFNKIYVSGHLSTPLKKLLAGIGKMGYSMICPGKTSQDWVKKMIDLVKPSQSQIIGNRLWPNEDKEFFEQKLFEETIYVTFRDAMYPIPKGYDAYLKKMYGDYMKIPEENERIIHDFEGYVLKK